MKKYFDLKKLYVSEHWKITNVQDSDKSSVTQFEKHNGYIYVYPFYKGDYYYWDQESNQFLFANAFIRSWRTWEDVKKETLFNADTVEAQDYLDALKSQVDKKNKMDNIKLTILGSVFLFFVVTLGIAIYSGGQ